MKIIAKPLAGLANKLRVIESTISLAKDLNAPVEINWVPDWQMVAQYHELFEPCEFFQVTNQNKYKYARSSFSMKGFRKIVSGQINNFYGIDIAFNELDICQQVRPRHWDIGTLVKNKNTYIETCHDFYSYHYNFSWVKPLPEIADAIAGFTEKLQNKDCIGLHIRRTDNVASIKQSPDELFENAIRQEIQGNENSIFFLATDDAATEQHFISLFGPEKILSYPKNFGRDNVTAIQDAVVDWTLLGKCSKLYCSFYSSFSETAAAVSKAETIVCKVNNH
jgi:hypothetical protein